MKITYEDKESKLIDESVPNKNKVRAEDMNEIKNVVNGLDTSIGNISNLKTIDKSNLVNAINEVYDLTKKYKNDKNKLNEETIKLFIKYDIITEENVQKLREKGKL